jgi:DNA-binding response OmpR family regulator
VDAEMRLLLAEDDESLGSGIQTGLTRSGYLIEWVRDGERAMAALMDLTESFAAVVLDIGLPKRSGLEVLRAARQAGNRVPILLLTARDTLVDKIAGLDAGADDYLLKPFDLDELRARIRAIVRRSEGRGESKLYCGEVVLDSGARTVTVAGNPVSLTRSEFALLELLLTRRGRVVSRGDIDAHLHGWGTEVESNVLDVHVSILRKKIGSSVIQTVRGIGYIVGTEND